MQQQEDAFCELLDATADSLSIRGQLDQLLKAGHLQLARARYAMFPDRLGSAQYSSNMHATTVIASSCSDAAPFQLKSRPAAVSPSPRLCSEVSPEDTEPSVNISDESQGSSLTMQSDALLTKRAHSEPETVYNAGKANEYSSDAISELAAKFTTSNVDKSPSHKPIAPQDPIKWFGFMVSPDLRQAQSTFSKAAAMLIELANAQHRMITIMNTVTHDKDIA